MVPIIYILFIFLGTRDISTKISQKPMSQSVQPVFSFLYFMNICPTFKQFIHFKSNFVYDCFLCMVVKQWRSFHFFVCDCSVFPTSLVLQILAPLLQINCPNCDGFVSGLIIYSYGLCVWFLSEYRSVVIMIGMQYSLKSETVMPPIFLPFVRIALAIQGLL